MSRAPDPALAPERTRRLLAAAAEPALRTHLLPTVPLVLERIELLRHGRQWLVRVRTPDGAEGLAVGHGGVLQEAYPIFLRRVAPAALGTDARAWEDTVRAIYLGSGAFGSSYKWQGLPFWTAIASLEMAVLDLLGKAADRPVTDLLGSGTLRREIALYRASSNRRTTAEEEVAWHRRFVEREGMRALKYKVGARMTHTDASTARDLALIPAMREAFPDLTLYADANGSYDVATGIRIGRLLAETGHALYEEPVPFDHYDETLAVRRALEGLITLAGGEQEVSLRHFLWQLDHRTLDLPQPDLFYFGGITRAVRVARAAHAVGMRCDAHISGYGLGFLYAAAFAACIPNPGPYQEFKGFDDDLPAEPVGGRFTPVDGTIVVPDGPGFGVALDPEWVARAETIC